MALVNRLVLVQYDVPGPILWHERMVLSHIVDEDYIVCTPDQDVHYEQLSILNDDLRGIRVRPGPGQLPPGIQPGQVYGLPAFTAAQTAAIQLEGQRELAAERAARGLGAPVAAAAPVGGADPGSPMVFVAGTLYWVAAEKIGEIKFGDAVQHVAAVQTVGAKAIHVLPDGQSLFVQCIDGGNHRQFMQKAADYDHRIVSQEIDALGKPECSLKEVAKKFSEVSCDWNLTGPRTCRWCISYLVVEALGLEGHHERFRSFCKIEASSWGVQEHYQLSMIAKHALQTDQLDGYNNLFLEVVFRRLQTIEYSYSERARELESKSAGGRLSLEEQQTFGGITRQAATLMVCPSLLDFVKAEVERDANLAKNLRKAREERELARKAGNKKKGGDDAP